MNRALIGNWFFITLKQVLRYVLLHLWAIQSPRSREEALMVSTTPCTLVVKPLELYLLPKLGYLEYPQNFSGAIAKGERNPAEALGDAPGRSEGGRPSSSNPLPTARSPDIDSTNKAHGNEKRKELILHNVLRWSFYCVPYI